MLPGWDMPKALSFAHPVPKRVCSVTEGESRGGLGAGMAVTPRCRGQEHPSHVPVTREMPKNRGQRGQTGWLRACHCTHKPSRCPRLGARLRHL